MADDVTLPGTGDVIAADSVTGTGEKLQLFKLAIATDGSRTLVPCDANGLTVQSPDATKFLVTEASGAASAASLSAIATNTTSIATAAKQDTGNASLSTIAGKDFATQTTLALIKAKTDNLDVAASTLATAAKQDTGNTSLASIDGKITAVNTGAVTISAALPAGNANIGDVDVASIAAGDNNIGNVDVVTLPALVASSAIIGNVRIDQTTPGTTNAVQANAGTNLNTSLLALESGGNLAAIRTALEIIDNFISGAKGLVTEDNSAAILSGMATAANQTTGNASLSTIATNTAPLIYAQMAAVASLVGPMVQGRVTDSVDSLTPDTIYPLSLTTEGRLRVVTVSESPNFTPWGNPFSWGDDGNDIDAYPASAW